MNNNEEPVEADEVVEAQEEQSEGFEMPHMGKKNCNWCYGKGFVIINHAMLVRQAGVCKCIRPKTQEEEEVRAGRVQQIRIGKHAKGRSKYYGKKGTWKLVPPTHDVLDFSDSFAWKFFSEKR